MAKAKFPKKTSTDAVVAPVQTAAATLPPVETTVTETKPEPAKTTPKPSIVRNEGRANLVPINVDEEIRRLAYLLSERRGFEPGHEAEDWITAEKEVRQRYHQRSA